MSQSIFKGVLTWMANRKPDSPTTNILPIDDIEKGLQFFCVVPGPDAKSRQISNPSFREISSLLKHYESHNRSIQWHHRPRIYTVLRLIGCLDFMDHFVSQNYMDSDLPLPLHLLPEELGDSKNNFLAIQERCLTSVIELEKGVEGRHMMFHESGDEYFHIQRSLGCGGYGHVDQVWSRLSHRQFAWKRFPRGKRLQEVQESSRLFSREISAMKRLSHTHLVKIVGSYTDPQCFAFLMEPVAQCNMSEYLQDVASQHIPSLRKFFGCLSNAITYLHDQKMHHLDIKLENILVEREKVFVGDFGAAHDFSRKERSTTWSSAPRTARYMPPEICRDPHSPKNYATDIWPLGVVFLEMTAVLRGQSLKSFHSYLPTNGSGHQFVYGNQAATHSYFEVLRTKGAGPEYDNEPLSWVKDMINIDPIGRPTARAIRNQIFQSNFVEQFRGFCCAGTDEWWDPPPIDLSAGLKPDDEGLYLEDEFFKAGELAENNYPLFDPLKNHRIESWLNYSAIAPQREPNADAVDDDEIMPFDIEDDEETIMPPALNRFAGRLADFDFLYSPPSTSHGQKPVVCEDTGDELPFDIDDDDDDANSVNSDITVRPAVKALDAGEAACLQILDNLDEPSPSSGLDLTASHTLSSEFPKTPIQTSANFDAPSQAIAEQMPDKSPKMLSSCNSYMPPDEAFTTSNPATRKSDSVHRSTPEVPGENPKKQISANEVKPVIQNTGKSLSPSNFELAPEKLIDQTPTIESVADNQGKVPNSPSRPALEPSLRIPSIPTEQIFAEGKSPDLTNNTSSSPQSNLEACLGKGNTKLVPDENKNPPLDEKNISPSDEKKISPTDKKKVFLSDEKKISSSDEKKIFLSDEKKIASSNEKRIFSSDEEKKSSSDEEKIPPPDKKENSPPNEKYNPCSGEKNCSTPNEKKNSPPNEKMNPPPNEEKNPPPEEKNNPPSDEANNTRSGENKYSASDEKKRSSPNEKQKPAPDKEKYYPPDDNKIPPPTRALTKENLLEHEQPAKFKNTKVPRNQILGTYAAFMQDAWEAESSAATSVLSERTSHVLHGIPPKLIVLMDRSHNSLLDYASKGNAAAVRQLLEYGCNPGTKKPRPRVLLAAVRGRSARHNKCVQALLENGADVNVRSNTGKTPLHIAIEHQNFEGYNKLIYTLLEHGAKPNVKDYNGDFPLLQILYGGYEPLEPHRRLALALILGQTYFTTDVNIMPPGTLNMPLHLAVRRKDSNAVGMLLAKGATVTKRNGAGVTPMAMAASGWKTDITTGQVEIARLLLEKGADVNERVESSDHTLLELAQNTKRTDLIDLLLEYSAGKTSKPTEGHSKVDEKR